MAKTIDDYKRDWEAANAIGDQAAMDAAHAGAEAIRAKSGYSGGDDGSQYIPLKTVPDGFTGSATTVGTYTSDQAKIKELMNKNSIAWHTADEATRKVLEQANKDLASMLGGTLTYDEASGYWSGEAAKPKVEIPSYTSTYSSQIDSLLDAVLNREEFSYDHRTDPTYLAYEDTYRRLGERAREDTLGDVASLNGGYASSWATTAASQAQNQYNQQLGDIIPTLYEAAYNRYLNEDSLRRDDLGIVRDMDQTDYNRYRDTVGDYKWQTEYETGLDQWQQEFDYTKEQNDIANSQWQQQFDWNKYMDEWNMSNTETVQKFDQMMTKWQLTGVADEEVANALGVPVGATTESYYFNKAQLELDQAKAAKGTGTGAGTPEVDFDWEKNMERTLAEASQKIHGTSQGDTKDKAAEYILTVAANRGLDMEDYYNLCGQLGIPNEVANSVLGKYENEMLEKEAAAATEGNKDYMYYAGLMGAAGTTDEARLTWLEQNKYNLPDGMYEKLLGLLGIK